MLTCGPGVSAEGDARVARGAGLRRGVELARSQPCWAERGVNGLARVLGWRAGWAGEKEKGR